jgi:hypothetical protein
MKPFGLIVSFALIASPVSIVNFDSGALGQPPKDWTIASTRPGTTSHWQILRDQSAPTQPYVLAKTSADPALAILNTLMVGDGDISVRIKPVSGNEVQGGGVVWRYRDQSNFYFARANVLDKSIALFKVQNGKRVQLGNAVHREIPLNNWSILKVSARGSRIQVFVDHRRILQAWDGTFNTPGKVGLCTDSDAVTYFDDFRVWTR